MRIALCFAPLVLMSSPALAPAAFFRRAGLVVNEHGQPRNRGEPGLHPHELVAVVNGETRGPRSIARVFPRLVGHDGNTLRALGRDLPEAQFKALRRAAPFLRGQVAKAVRLKFAPELHFQPDTALDYAMHIDEVMRRPEVARDLSPHGEPHKDDDSE